MCLVGSGTKGRVPRTPHPYCLLSQAQFCVLASFCRCVSSLRKALDPPSLAVLRLALTAIQKYVLPTKTRITNTQQILILLPYQNLTQISSTKHHFTWRPWSTQSIVQCNCCEQHFHSQMEGTVTRESADASKML